MKTVRKPWYRIPTAVVVALSFVLTGVGNAVHGAPSSALVTVKVGVGPFLDYQPWYLAHQMGFDKAQGLNLNIQNFTQQQLAISTLHRGDLALTYSCHECDFSYVKSVPELRDWMVTNQFKGFIIVGRKGALTYSGLVNKVGPKQAKARVVKSWKGKSFVMVESLRRGLLEAALSSVGLTINDVKIINFADDAKAALAFLQGTGDYYTGSLPQESKLLFQYANRFVNVGGTEVLGPAGLWYSTMVSQASWLKNQPNIVYKLLAVWYRTTRYMRVHPQKSFPLITSELNSAAAASFTVKQVIFLATRLNEFETLSEAKRTVFNPSSPLYWRLSAAYYAKQSTNVLPAGFKVDTVVVAQQFFNNFLKHTALVKWVNSPLP